MKRKVLILGIIVSMSLFGITHLIAADYYGNVPSEQLLAWGPEPDPQDADEDGVVDEEDFCQGQPGDIEHCGCPTNLVIVDAFGQCTLVTDPDNPGHMNDGEVPVGGGLLLLLGSAIAYGATIRHRNKKNNLD